MSTTTSTTVIHEPSAWMRQRCAERVARVRQLGLDPFSSDPLIVAPLGTTGVPGEDSDRQCDRCQKVTPVGPDFVLVSRAAAPGLLLTGGLCVDCAVHEGWGVES